VLHQGSADVLAHGEVVRQLHSDIAAVIGVTATERLGSQ
jgi:hypothetical protein